MKAEAGELVIGRESFFWHKLHSLTGVIPVGFYLVQHITLNSFSLAGPQAYNSVGKFFSGVPFHLFMVIQAVILGSFLFHGVYGLFITSRGQSNYFSGKYKWSQNRMYLLQRVSGIVAFVFIVFHYIDASVRAKVQGHAAVEYAAWGRHLAEYGYFILIIYMIGVLASSYHLFYGLWNFCIRWGITVSERAQIRVQKFSLWAFILFTLLGWAALFGFFMHKVTPSSSIQIESSGPPQPV
ncbi:MAG: hypothetical protein ACK4XJ_10220 [Fimbriimonadaceae bacterium]